MSDLPTLGGKPSVLRLSIGEHRVRPRGYGACHPAEVETAIATMNRSWGFQSGCPEN